MQSQRGCNMARITAGVLAGRVHQFIQPAFLVREFSELCTVCADAGERREGKGENSLDGVEARELERS